MKKDEFEVELELVAKIKTASSNADKAVQSVFEKLKDENKDFEFELMNWSSTLNQKEFC